MKKWMLRIGILLLLWTCPVLAAESDNCFYYQQLTEEEQQVYETIYQGLCAFQEEIPIKETDAETLDRCFIFVLYDHPEIFWVDTYSYLYYEEGIADQINPKYNTDKEEATQQQLQIEAKKQEMLSGLENYTEYDKVKTIYEKIILMTDYQKGSTYSQDIRSCMLNQTATCAGYSRTFQYLLNSEGIFCTYVSGTVPSGSHAWNLIQLSGEYYYVDVTWGDPVFAGYTQTEDDGKENLVYDYFCCTTEEISREHQAAYEALYPICTAEEYNYFQRNQLCLTDGSRDTVTAFVHQQLDQDQTQLCMKFLSEFDYQQAYTELMDQGLANDLMNYYMIGHGVYSCGLVSSVNESMWIIYMEITNS